MRNSGKQKTSFHVLRLYLWTRVALRDPEASVACTVQPCFCTAARRSSTLQLPSPGSAPPSAPSRSLERRVTPKSCSHACRAHVHDCYFDCTRARRCSIRTRADAPHPAPVSAAHLGRSEGHRRTACAGLQRPSAAYSACGVSGLAAVPTRSRRRGASPPIAPTTHARPEKALTRADRAASSPRAPYCRHATAAPSRTAAPTRR